MDPRTHTAATDEGGKTTFFRHLTNRHPPAGAADTRAARRARVTERLVSTMRGLIFGGIAYLFGSCALPFGAAPLGLALLAASTSGAGSADIYRIPSDEAGTPVRRRGTAYPWYILAGLILSALTHPVTLPSLGWVGIYTFCVLLRLAVLFFVDPPLLPGETLTPGLRGTIRSAGRYLRMCLRSAGYNLGWRSLFGREADEMSGTYYAGSTDRSSPGRRERVGSAEGGPDSGDGTGAASGPVNGPTFCPPADARLFCEHPFLRILTGAVTGFAAGTFALVKGGFAVFDLFGALFQTIAVPLGVLLLCPLFGESGEALIFAPHPLNDPEDAARPTLRALTARFKLLPLLSAACLIPAVVYAARTLPLPAGDLPEAGGALRILIRLSTVLGLISVLSAVSRLGFWPGLIAALAAGLSDGRVMLPAYLLTVCVYALLRVLSHRAGVVGGCTAGVIYISFCGVSVLLSALPSFLLAIPCFLLWERVLERMPGLSVEEALRVEDFTLAAAGRVRTEAHRARLSALSGAFADVSATFRTLSGQLKQPGREEPERLCASVCRERCAGCLNHDVCAGRNRARVETLIREMAAQLAADGRADAGRLPEETVSFCVHAADLAAEVNRRSGRLTGTLLRNEKMELIASDCADVAALLTDVLERDEEAADCRSNREAADAIYEYLLSLGLPVRGVAVCGRRNRRVIVRGVGARDAAPFSDVMRRQLGALCGVPLSEPVFTPCGGCAEMVFTSEPTLGAAYAGSTVPAGQREGDPLPPPLTDGTVSGGYDPPPICGDHIAIFRSDTASLYALISDGMGSGEEASVTSGLCAAFLERMLSAGCRVEISLRMLNRVLRAKNDGDGSEVTATVDLLELDLTNGHAVFAKAGASPTYVVRAGVVYKLRSRNYPFGILRDTSPRLLRFRMHPGDVVVMVSDGVTLGNDECPWLIDLLSDPLPDSMDSLRLDILRRALASGSPDDLSAIAIRVEEGTKGDAS